jgi:N-acetylneuraminic acid mutarotase
LFVCLSPSSSPFVTILCGFGGADSRRDYNDTWLFDVPTRKWTELQRTGYTPSPRRGHAAAFVDDVMYVFGGRGVDGADLDDMYAFKLSSKDLAS